MSRDLNDLTPEFKTKVEALLSACQASDYRMKPFFTLRTPFDQAKLWRQSRSQKEVDHMLKRLDEHKADFLIHCIESVGSQHGRPVTRVIPGFSWHQWGEAIDCFWELDGRAEWSSRKKINDKNGYRNYADIAKEIGLTSGGFWRTFKDWPHVQMQQTSNPGLVFSVEDINQEMIRRFSTGDELLTNNVTPIGSTQTASSTQSDASTSPKEAATTQPKTVSEKRAS